MTPAPTIPAPGLCAACRHLRVIRSGRGSVFAMCERGLGKEPGYVKYPRLPVLRCPGLEPDGEGATTIEGR